ncbi:MAG: DUF4262 domain-containing protein [Gemmataceae bacterium]
MVRSLTDGNLDDGDRKLLSDIDRFGWHVVMIPEADGTPGWSFSVGLFSTFSHPEVVVFGLSMALAGQVINGIGADIQKGKTFEFGQDYPEILEGVLCTFRPVVARWYRPFLGYATWYYQGTEFPVLQCIWPDKQQHYPWQPEYKQAWLWAQPLLFELEPEPARVVRLLESVGGE